MTLAESRIEMQTVLAELFRRKWTAEGMVKGNFPSIP